MKKEFKYKSKFHSSANFAQVNNNPLFISNASMGIEDLTKLIPDETCGKSHNVCAAFNAAVVNLVNANDDAISTETAIAIYKDFIHQPINIEHDKNNVVGFITNAGFSSFSNEESKLMTEEEISSETGPFNISLSCLLWKYVDSWTTDFLAMTNDEQSYFYKKISASWEIGFDDYQIVLGSKKLSDATIITDEAEIEKYTKMLRSEGGTGHTSDGTPVYRLIVGDAKPLGCALTSNPAAPVKGVIIKEECCKDAADSMDMEDDMKEEDAKKVSKCSISQNISENNDNLISQNDNNQVINNKSMEFTSLEDFVSKISQASGTGADTISDFIQSQIKEGDNKFAQAQAEAQEKQASLDKSLAELSTAKADMEQMKNELETIKNQVAEAAKQERFNSRLESLSSKYDLDDKTRKFLAKQIIDLEDEAFESWLKEDGEVVLASKVKVVANTEVGVEDAIKTAVASTEFVPNASDAQEPAKKSAKAWVIGKDVVVG